MRLAPPPFQDAVLAQPARAPVAQSWGTVPWTSKQLVQVRARSPFPGPQGEPCPREAADMVRASVSGIGFLLLGSFRGGKVVKCTWNLVCLGTSQNTLTTHADTILGHLLGFRQALKLQTSN